MPTNPWELNGLTLPRNPDSFSLPTNKSSVYYETMIDGSRRRLDLPIKWSGRVCKFGWKAADMRTRNALASAITSHSMNVIEFTGTQPALQLNVYFDDLSKDDLSAEVFDPTFGQGGIRRDIEITGFGEAYFRSVSLVPTGTTPLASNISKWFGGALGVPQFDNIPQWDGKPWLNFFGTASSPVGSNTTMSNLGTAPWAGIIKVQGPFTAFSLNGAWSDVDGTGGGVTFTWTGATVVAGNYILFDSGTSRCYIVVSGIQQEVYTFTLTLPGSANVPFPYWPAVPSGEFTVSTTVNGTTGASKMDYSNNGTEQFRYV